MTDGLSHKDRMTDLGTIKIHNDAIATIASLAAMDIKGVCRMGGGIGKTLYEIVLRRASSKGVRIETREGEVKLTISIIVEHGVDIPRVADEVQESVKRSVERMTGLTISEVDVVVEGVYAPSPGESAPAQDRQGG